MTQTFRLLVVTIILVALPVRAQEQAPLTFDAAPPAAGAAPAQVTPTPVYGQPPQGAASLGAATAPVGAPVQPATQQGPAPPFVLSDVELRFVYQILKAWEVESSKINTFSSDFERQEFDAVWNPGSTAPMKVSYGVLSYSKPDKGSFKIDRILRWVKADPKNPAPDAPGSFEEQKDEIGEHWVCDGKAVYEYDQRVKQLKVTPIPEDMRGVAIADGPLPFIFGAQADKLMERYWIKPHSSDEQRIWLVAYPRRQSDAANYECVDLMLDRKTMQPKNIRLHLPGGQQKHLYTFGDEDHPPKINAKMEEWFGGLFGAPRTPLGWKKVVMTDTELPPGAAVPGPQAALPAAGVPR